MYIFVTIICTPCNGLNCAGGKCQEKKGFFLV